MLGRSSRLIAVAGVASVMFLVSSAWGLEGTNTGININNFVGANTFYGNSFDGSDVNFANIEAGHIWNGHNALTHVNTYFADPGTADGDGGVQGELDRHATWVGGAVGGRDPGFPIDTRGIAFNSNMWSGAIATDWGGTAYSLSFGVSDTTVETAYQDALVNGVGGQTARVVNSSWGGGREDGADFTSAIVDGAAFDSNATVVFSAGNDSSNPKGPTSGFNIISVGATTGESDANPFENIAGFSSRGLNDFFNPNGRNSDAGAGEGTTITNVRAVVDIVAPGTDLTLPFYGGPHGGNDTDIGGSDAGGTANSFSGNVGGTSFSAPIVAGGATLLVDAAQGLFGGDPQAQDGRVIKAVLMNSADKLPGWDNGQSDVGGEIITSQALDTAQGAGQMNLTRAYDNFINGTTNVAGSGGGTIERQGWDFGSVATILNPDPVNTTSYFFDEALGVGSTITTTLAWFMNRDWTSGNEFIWDNFDDLDLEIWLSDSAGNLLERVAASQSDYNSVEHLNFTVDTIGYYSLVVERDEEVFDFIPGGDGDTESFGLAWDIDLQPVPEPATGALIVLGAVALLRRRRRV